MKTDKKSMDGLSAYDILRLYPELPRLPTARSMTQATIDYRNREDDIIAYHESKIIPKPLTEDGSAN